MHFPFEVEQSEWKLFLRDFYSFLWRVSVV